MRTIVGNEIADSIIQNAKIMLKHYLSLKYQFSNVEFWGDIFNNWDNDIARMREYIRVYK